MPKQYVACNVIAVKLCNNFSNQISVKGKGTTRSVRIRNPWGGKYEWKGTWRDDSKEWKLVSNSEKKET